MCKSVSSFLSPSCVFSYVVAESNSFNPTRSRVQPAIFRVNVTLSIPNIAMVPALEEVQQALNRAVECVVSVSKGVGQWSKERISKVSLFICNGNTIQIKQNTLLFIDSLECQYPGFLPQTHQLHAITGKLQYV